MKKFIPLHYLSEKEAKQHKKIKAQLSTAATRGEVELLECRLDLLMMSAISRFKKGTESTVKA